MKRPVKTHTFHGRRYKIDIEPDGLHGECDAYHIGEKDRKIGIYIDPATKKGLITIIHECLHAEDWHASEEAVDRTSAEIGNFLWRLGYRLK